jgi:hypothetical protein
MDRETEKIEIRLASEQHNDKQRDKKDAQRRQTVRQVH